MSAASPRTAAQSVPAATSNTVATSTRISYGLGDLASNLTWTTLTAFLLFYYTDVVGIAATTAGTVLLVGRVADAVVDPVVGLCVDRTRTRWGRARPYLIFGAPVLSIALVLTFTVPSSGPLGITYALITFLIVGVTHSVVNVPYGAMLPMITRDKDVRLRMSGYRMAGASIGMIAVSAGVMPLVNALGGQDKQRGFLLTAVILAVLSTLMFWVVARMCREQVDPPATQHGKGQTKAALLAMLRNRHWVAISSATLFAFIRLGLTTAGAVYYALAVLDDVASTSFILLAFSASALLGAFLTPWLLSRTGRRRGIVFGLLVCAALYAVLLVLDTSTPVFLAVFLVANLAGGCGFVAAAALISDTIDHQEESTGRRDEGLLYAGYSFATKVGTALGGALFAWVLAWGDYQAGDTGADASQAIKWAFIGLPLLLCLVQAAFMRLYGLDQPATPSPSDGDKH
ncbi:MFS transporter [Streptomyces sp. NBC_00059]|uniref:MFS transporter n=1 Tax=Streptomyces sp. NBC_00059 TaxID=2975635 RepID=UPI0022542A2C|nr:glycoside-pentoside-hexuronide (GPH):cation symporter [Streptomyces sp. NBC_00059]MCX5412736.1 glycoside-pentoside-hexuronide (GPH):cation symporter [Streptomyces sp. NBC_00059]